MDELLAELIADPSPERFSVYADYLQLKGDPRGELIALDLHARATNTPRAPRADELERDLEAKLLDGLDGKFTLRWEHGFVREIVVPSDLVYPLAERFAVDDLAMLRSVRVAPMGPFRDETVQQCQPIDLLVDAPFARTLERVAIGAQAMALVRASRLERLIASLPALTAIELRSNTRLDDAQLSVLERFTRIEALAVWGVGDDELLARLVDMPWPNLRSLVLEPRGEWNRPIPQALAHLLDGGAHPKLTELALFARYEPELLGAIVESALGRRLRAYGTAWQYASDLTQLRDRIEHIALIWPTPAGYRHHGAYVDAFARRLRELGRFAEAVVHHRRACELDPRSWVHWRELADTLEASGDLPASLAARERALELRPS